jgi:serine/threonine protein kinase
MTEYFPGPSDIWSLGVIFFTLLTGTYPFKASSDTELYKKIIKAHVKVPEFVSNEASRLLYRMLRSEPKSRPSIKSLIKDPWLSSDSLSEKDSESRLSLSNSLIKDNTLPNKPNDNVAEKGKSAWKLSFKRLLTIEKP